MKVIRLRIRQRQTQAQGPIVLHMSGSRCGTVAPIRRSRSAGRGFPISWLIVATICVRRHMSLFQGRMRRHASGQLRIGLSAGPIIGVRPGENESAPPARACSLCRRWWCDVSVAYRPALHWFPSVFVASIGYTSSADRLKLSKHHILSELVCHVRGCALHGRFLLIAGLPIAGPSALTWLA